MADAGAGWGETNAECAKRERLRLQLAGDPH
jgi:hypothetical protein